jgi:UDP-3-O-[3-hydroxymyristoyl] glucosamine N-acyltransferase
MADPRFFRRAGPFVLHQLAASGEAKLANPADSDIEISDVAAIESAGPGELTYLESARLRGGLVGCRASAILLPSELAAGVPTGIAVLVSDAPAFAFLRITKLFYPDPAIVPGIDPTAHIAPDARLGAGLAIGPGVVIGAAAEIGAGTSIGAHSVIAAGVTIGQNCRIADQCTISHAFIGDRVVLDAGVRIGQPGFGMVATPLGAVRRPQLGRVVIHDDVEIGANTTVDRGAAGDTVIGEGCKIDNLVQIGHNVRLGRGCVICAQVGISGSCVVGDYVSLGGQVGISDHVTLGSGTRVMAQAGLVRDVEPGGEVGGTPAVPIRQHHRQAAILARLAKRRDG